MANRRHKDYTTVLIKKELEQVRSLVTAERKKIHSKAATIAFLLKEYKNKLNKND